MPAPDARPAAHAAARHSSAKTAARRGSVNGAAISLVLIGAALVLLSFEVLDWYAAPQSTADTAGAVTFSALRASTRQLGGAGVALAYFDWLSWAALIGVIVAGTWAALPTRAADPLRVLGFALGTVGAVATYYALLQHFDATGSTHSVLYNSTWGMWAAIIGYATAAIGAVRGPRSAP
ncbi:hypothetical protein [uncultured Jatrophihabitans sp.]|uniref:hypothetical protein n=1 Tax=uncultured Jatrophihabitans sp. TaxID=1610747 RepID=UPI0035CC5290